MSEVASRSVPCRVQYWQSAKTRADSGQYRQARIQGRVQLHAIIDKDGRVGELQVVSGHPLLVKAALDAVQNWRYQATVLNGDPVEVDTTIDVNFVLGG